MLRFGGGGGQQQRCTRHGPLHSWPLTHTSSTPPPRLADLQFPRRAVSSHPAPGTWPGPLAHSQLRLEALTLENPRNATNGQRPGTPRRTRSPTAQALKGGSQRVFPAGPGSWSRGASGRGHQESATEPRPRRPKTLHLPGHLSSSRFQRPPAGLCSEETPIAKAPNWVVSPTPHFET